MPTAESLALFDVMQNVNPFYERFAFKSCSKYSLSLVVSIKAVLVGETKCDYLVVKCKEWGKKQQWI